MSCLLSRSDSFARAGHGATIGDVTVSVVIYPGEDGYLVAECPELPGCASQGRTREEALENIREAIEGWLEVEAASDTAAGRRPIEIVELAV